MDNNVIEKLESIERGIAEIISRQEDEAGQDQFTFKTSDFTKIRLITNIERLVNAIQEIKEFRRSIYKGWNNDSMVMTEGFRWKNLDTKEPIEIPEPEYGEKGIHVMSEEDILKRIDRIFDDNDIWSLTEDL